MKSQARWTAVCILLLTLSIAPVAHGGELSIPVGQIAYIDNEDGASRVLFRLPNLDGFNAGLIQRATLTVPYTLQNTQDSHLELRVCPLTSTWSEGSVRWETGWETAGGDFDHELYGSARADLRGESGTLSFDLTVALKEIVEEGMEDHGFIVSVRSSEREGLRLSDLVLLQNLGSASVTVSYLETLRGPPVRPRG